MSDLVDMRVMALLCSRLCHEVASPLQAVTSGIEMLLDVGDDMHDETVSLVESSANRLTARVMFYRMAYGTAGESGVADLATARKLTDDLLVEGRLSLEWPDADRNPTLPAGVGRMLLNLAVAGSEALARGGVLTIEVDDSGSGHRLQATARGPRAGFHEDIRPNYFGDTSIENLSAHNIHSYFTVKIAESMGTRVEVSENGESEVRFEVRLP